jgi:hypothetical protein
MKKFKIHLKLLRKPNQNQKIMIPLKTQIEHSNYIINYNTLIISLKQQQQPSHTHRMPLVLIISEQTL